MQLNFIRRAFSMLGVVTPGLAARLAVRLFYTPRRFPRANWERAALASATEANFNWKGRRFAAYVWGEGPTILLVHGWEGRASQLGKFALAIAEQGFRVVAFDGPAHGAAAERRTTLVEFAEVVQGAIDAFGPIHGIVAHSFGAAAASIALERGARTERLVLLSCPYSIRNVVGRFATFVGLPARAFERMWPIMHRLHGCPEEALCFERIGPSLQLPCLMIHDRTDRYVPVTDGRAASARIGGSTFVETDGLGHLRILQDGKVVEEAVGFVTGDAPNVRSDRESRPSAQVVC